MDIKSVTKYARFSPKKGRDVVREIVGLPVSDAIDTLTYTPKKAAFLINKTLKTAVADAENNFDMDAEELIVKEAMVTAGPMFKRFKPRARGSASAIRKRTSHIMITVTKGEVDEDSKARAKNKAKKKKSTPASATTNTAPEQAPVEFTSDAKETRAPKKVAAKNAAKKAAPKAKAEAKATPTKVDEKLGLLYTSAPAEVDDLKKISGVGPVLEEKLNESGLYTFKQVTEWSAANIEAFDDILSFKGRIERDNWIEQAKTLHEEKYGN